MDIFGYVNREQLVKTAAAAFTAGLLAAMGVVIADLPKIIDATAPIAAMLITGLWWFHDYLRSGSEIKFKRKHDVSDHSVSDE
jgi:hypothetical protein